jgi:murein DD-endopeptidase MepM/ murein hydrolase activator NlpD
MSDEQGNGLVSRAQRAIEAARQRAESANQPQQGPQAEQTRRRLLSLASRFTSHAAIITVSVLAIALAGLRLGTVSDSTDLSEGGGDASQGLGRSPTILVNADRSGRLTDRFQQAGASIADGSIIVRDPGVEQFDIARGISPGGDPGAVLSGPGAAAAAIAKREQIETYRVESGDAIITIAEKYGLSPATIAWSNPAVEENPELLRIGQELTILPLDGVYHTVKEGDTVAGLAKRYRAEEKDIVEFSLNRLGGGTVLQVGTQLVIPNGVKQTARTAAAPAPVRRRAASINVAPSGSGANTGTFLWPTRGVITQNYWAYHRGIDIANSSGTAIYASDGGYVSYAGWSPVGYGYMIKITHNNGFETLYAHLSYYDVDLGQAVSQGQIIGRMGSTGNSTGPHLHYEIRYGGVPQNPFSYLGGN